MLPCKNRKTDKENGIDETGRVSISVRQSESQKQGADTPLTFNEGKARFANRLCDEFDVPRRRNMTANEFKAADMGFSKCCAVGRNEGGIILSKCEEAF